MKKQLFVLIISLQPCNQSQRSNSNTTQISIHSDPCANQRCQNNQQPYENIFGFCVCPQKPSQNNDPVFVPNPDYGNRNSPTEFQPFLTF